MALYKRVPTQILIAAYHKKDGADKALEHLPDAMKDQQIVGTNAAIAKTNHKGKTSRQGIGKTQFRQGLHIWFPREFIVLSLAEATRVRCVEQHDSRNNSTLLRFSGFGGDDAAIALVVRIRPITKAQYDTLDREATCTNDIQDMFENGDKVRVEFHLFQSVRGEGAFRIWWR